MTTTPNNESIQPLHLITGASCPSCGRDNGDYGNVCTADDCPGVMKYDAGPDMAEALRDIIWLSEGAADEVNQKQVWEKARAALRKAGPL